MYHGQASGKIRDWEDWMYTVVWRVHLSFSQYPVERARSFPCRRVCRAYQLEVIASHSALLLSLLTQSPTSLSDLPTRQLSSSTASLTSGPICPGSSARDARKRCSIVAPEAALSAVLAGSNATSLLTSAGRSFVADSEPGIELRRSAIRTRTSRRPRSTAQVAFSTIDSPRC